MPHSYPGCSQHAPNEHILLSVTEEALGIMAGLFWDLGEMPRALWSLVSSGLLKSTGSAPGDAALTEPTK